MEVTGLMSNLESSDRHFIRRILMYIVMQNGLQYNAHDLGYSNRLFFEA